MRGSPWGELSPQVTECTSQQILDTNHKKFYNQTHSVSQLHFHNATHGIEWASDSLMNKQDAAH